MKTTLLIVISFLVFSCNPYDKDLSLEGEYAIVDFTMTPQFAKDSIARRNIIPIITSSNNTFIFSTDNSIVKIDPKLGMKFFGDSIFQYELKDKFIALSNNDKTINIPYKNDNGIIRLLVDKKGIERFSIIPSKN
ncbi:hypothetical protein [Cyclobacterium marinum]|uniref:Lipoprotein n=1 Tax=Cyclobacterium marinum (strain ATCC 25205 / DSM 745 / LMG 13164 / NCIMB 1802) TaxID=880070 RepID=G0IYE3_CYCMS|nr:hypothetical protein [Cyclobacterium marinum]AEL25678.1 hypothetical protein Cycma_1928 [Cyclobacterium marinum DSM 745]MBI0401108.1 hypothetical protein [Cyclobacterium marinum]MBR9776550.1 hypothetical protein [Cytophagales bacterium]|tara:strand:+ start:18087 stop:18491 length:405 start_codon:yes stop_codon:yes gene_type:complete